MKDKLRFIGFCLFLIVLSLVMGFIFGVNTCEAQVDGHRIYKAIDENGVTLIQGSQENFDLLIDNYGATSSATNMFEADLAYVLDLNGDLVINTGDVTEFLGVYGSLIYEPGPECSGTEPECFYVDYQFLIWAIAPYQGLPFLRMQTGTEITTWWWVEE